MKVLSALDPGHQRIPIIPYFQYTAARYDFHVGTLGNPHPSSPSSLLSPPPPLLPHSPFSDTVTSRHTPRHGSSSVLYLLTHEASLTLDTFILGIFLRSSFVRFVHLILCHVPFISSPIHPRPRSFLCFSLDDRVPITPIY